MNVPTGDNPVKTVEVLGDKYILNKTERATILRHFIMSNDYTAFGLVNAVTRSSQDISDYNRATELERLGGTILDESVKLSKVQPNMLLLPQAV